LVVANHFRAGRQDGLMNLTPKQIEAVKAGHPVLVEREEAGRLYVLNEELYEQVMIALQSEPQQEAFRQFSMKQADRIALEDADS
jgi:PHD/YefM family antitoxin component YafN of YafNO toxin-antitoxin module